MNSVAADLETRREFAEKRYDEVKQRGMAAEERANYLAHENANLEFRLDNVTRQRNEAHRRADTADQRAQAAFIEHMNLCVPPIFMIDACLVSPAEVIDAQYAAEKRAALRQIEQLKTALEIERQSAQFNYNGRIVAEQHVRDIEQTIVTQAATFDAALQSAAQDIITAKMERDKARSEVITAVTIVEHVKKFLDNVFGRSLSSALIKEATSK